MQISWYMHISCNNNDPGFLDCETFAFEWSIFVVDVICFYETMHIAKPVFIQCHVPWWIEQTHTFSPHGLVQQMCLLGLLSQSVYNTLDLLSSVGFNVCICEGSVVVCNNVTSLLNMLWSKRSWIKGSISSYQIKCRSHV